MNSRTINYEAQHKKMSQKITSGALNSTRSQTRSFHVDPGLTTGKTQTNIVHQTTHINKQNIEVNIDEENTFLGDNSGISKVNNPSGVAAKRNTFIGANTGRNIKHAFDNLFIGDNAGLLNNSGGNNLFIGNNAGRGNVSMSNNMFIGHKSGEKINEAEFNTLLGIFSGCELTNGVENTFIGFRSGKANQDGSLNVFVGADSGMTNNLGNSNVFIGQEAGMLNENGSANIFVGNEAGKNIVNGNLNTFIGSRQHVKDDVSNSIAIGSDIVIDDDDALYLSPTLKTDDHDDFPYTHQLLFNALNGRVVIKQCATALEFIATKDFVCAPFNSSKKIYVIKTSEAIIHLLSASAMNLDTIIEFFFDRDVSNITFQTDNEEIYGKLNSASDDYEIGFVRGDSFIEGKQFMRGSRLSFRNITNSVWIVEGVVM